jgi:peptide deformylase
MILPIIAYGDPVLKKKGKEITKDYPNFDTLLENMFETMYNASGVGLAAPQIGLVDTTPFAEDDVLTKEEQDTLNGFKRVFINAKIVEEEGDDWAFNEGCLSIPDVREDVFRKPNITVEYLDENFKSHKESFDGLIARVVQHEYDHIELIYEFR